MEVAFEMSSVLHNKKETRYHEKPDEHPFCCGLRSAFVVRTMFVCHSLLLVVKAITIDCLTFISADASIESALLPFCGGRVAAR